MDSTQWDKLKKDKAKAKKLMQQAGVPGILLQLRWGSLSKAQRKKIEQAAKGKGWFEEKEEVVTAKGTEKKAPKHRKAALKAHGDGAINEPIRTEPEALDKRAERKEPIASKKPKEEKLSERRYKEWYDKGFAEAGKKSSIYKDVKSVEEDIEMVKESNRTPAPEVYAGIPNLSGLESLAKLEGIRDGLIAKASTKTRTTKEYVLLAHKTDGARVMSTNASTIDKNYTDYYRLSLLKDNKQIDGMDFPVKDDIFAQKEIEDRIEQIIKRNNLIPRLVEVKREFWNKKPKPTKKEELITERQERKAQSSTRVEDVIARQLESKSTPIPEKELVALQESARERLKAKGMLETPELSKWNFNLWEKAYDSTLGTRWEIPKIGGGRDEQVWVSWSDKRQQWEVNFRGRNRSELPEANTFKDQSKANEYAKKYMDSHPKGSETESAHEAKQEEATKTTKEAPATERKAQEPHQPEKPPLIIKNSSGILVLTVGNEEYKIGALEGKGFMEGTIFYNFLYRSPYQTTVPAGHIEYHKILHYFKKNVGFSKKKSAVQDRGQVQGTSVEETIKHQLEGKSTPLDPEIPVRKLINRGNDLQSELNKRYRVIAKEVAKKLGINTPPYDKFPETNPAVFKETEERIKTDAEYQEIKRRMEFHEDYTEPKYKENEKYISTLIQKAETQKKGLLETTPTQEVKDWMKKVHDIEDYKGGRSDRIGMLQYIVYNGEIGKLRDRNDVLSVAHALGKDLGYGEPPSYGISTERYYAEKIAAETGKDIPIIKGSSIVKPPTIQSPVEKVLHPIKPEPEKEELTPTGDSKLDKLLKSAAWRFRSSETSIKGKRVESRKQDAIQYARALYNFILKGGVEPSPPDHFTQYESRDVFRMAGNAIHGRNILQGVD